MSNMFLLKVLVGLRSEECEAGDGHPKGIGIEINLISEKTYGLNKCNASFLRKK